METTRTITLTCRTDCSKPSAVRHVLTPQSGRSRAIFRCSDHAALEPETLATLRLMEFTYDGSYPVPAAEVTP